MPTLFLIIFCRLLVKTDIDSVIKGSQWPLSVYGPFKDKPNIPQFIEDQSFEELRAAAYEAKTNGSFPNMAAQVAQRFAEAKHRMSQLYELNNESLKMIVDLYNSNSTETDSQSTTMGFGSARPNNPFSKVNVPTNTASNVFGAKTANPFASSNASNSLFGNPASASQQTSSVFGGAATNNSSNIFGGGNATFGSSSVCGSSVFGGGNASTSFGASLQQPSVFGGSANNAATSGIFLQAAVPASSQTAPSNNIFGNSSFGAAPAGGNVFGGGANFASQPTNIFGGGGSTAAPAATGSSIFGQTPSVFGGSANTNTNVFGTNAPAATQATSNIFGNAAPSQPNSMFGAAPASQNIFSNGSSMFGAPATQPQQPTGIFGQAPDAAAAPNPFGAPTTQQPPAFSAPSAFGTSPQPASVFGASAAQQPPPPFGAPVQTSTANAFGNNYQSPFGAPQQSSAISAFGGATTLHNQPAALATSGPDPLEANVYSRLDSLSAEDVAAFNATAFDLATIPTRPPPRELCF